MNTELEDFNFISIFNDFEYKTFKNSLPPLFDYVLLRKYFLRMITSNKSGINTIKSLFYFFKAYQELYYDLDNEQFTALYNGFVAQIRQRLYYYFEDDTDSFCVKDLIFIRNKLNEHKDITEYIFNNLDNKDRLRYKNLFYFLYCIATEKQEYFLNSSLRGKYKFRDYENDVRDYDFKKLDLKFINQRRSEFNTLYGALFS